MGTSALVVQYYEKNGRLYGHLGYCIRYRDIYIKRAKQIKFLLDTLLGRPGCCSGRPASAEDTEKDQED